MSNLHHSLAQVEGAGTLFVAGQVLNTTGTLTVTNLSSPAFFTGDVTVTDGGVGQPSIVVTNFLGPLGFAIPVISLTSNTAAAIQGFTANITSNSYSGDTLTVAIEINSVNLHDSSLFFQIFAF